MSESIIRSIVRIALGHLNAGVMCFNAYGLDFSIEKLQKSTHAYAIMAETQNPFCVAHITA